MGRRRNVERDRRIVRLARSARHMTHAQIGEATGVSRDTVLRVLRNARIGGAPKRSFTARHRAAVESVEGKSHWQLRNGAAKSDLVLRNHIIGNPVRVTGSMAAMPTAHPSALRHLVHRPAIYIRESAAANPSCPPAAVAWAARSGYAEIRQAAARNPTCPRGVLAALAVHDYEPIRRCVAANPNTPARALQRLADDPYTQLAVAGNPRCPRDVLVRLADVDSDQIAAALAANPNCPRELLERLIEDPALPKSVRIAAARNPRCPQDVLVRLAPSGGIITQCVARHPNSPTELLRRLIDAADTSRPARRYARRQLDQRSSATSDPASYRQGLLL